MEESSFETDDNSRLTENFNRKTVQLILNVTDEVFKISQNNFKKQIGEVESEISKIAFRI
jgi:hypothetical protein